MLVVYSKQPAVVAAISFLLGGVAASAISAAWQRRAHIFRLRFATAEKTVSTYQEYVRLLRRARGARLEQDPDDFDRVHTALLSQAVMAKTLFGDSTSKEIRALARRLANVRNLKMNKQDEQAGEQLMGAYKAAELVTSDMFELLSQ